MTEFPPPDAVPDAPPDARRDVPDPPDDEPDPADHPAAGMVEATTARLAELDDAPVAAHVAVYDELHTDLQGALASLDEG